jgi:hypothetical protein
MLAMKRRVIPALLASCLALTPYLRSDDARAAQPEDRDAIQALLDRRAAAVIARDEDAFLATVSKTAREFRMRQRRLFERMETLPIGSYSLEVDWARYGDLSRPSDRTRHPEAADVAIPVTEERYTLEGFDPAPAAEDLFYTFVEIDGDWLIAGDSDLDDITLFSARHPWDFHSQRVTERGRFLLMEPVCDRCPSAPPNALALARSAMQRVNGYWGLPWRKRVPVVIPASAADLKRMLQATFDVGNFVAFAYSTVEVDEGIDYTGHRIILNPDAFVGRSSGSTLEILAHELLHVAGRYRSGPFVPTFVEEGIAEYVGRDQRPDALAFFDLDIATGAFDGRLPEDYQFSTGSGSDIFRSYQKSYSAIRFFIDRWGIGRFQRFYTLLGRPDIDPGTVGYHVDRAMTRSIGMTLDEFERAWAGSIDSP